MSWTAQLGPRCPWALFAFTLEGRFRCAWVASDADLKTAVARSAAADRYLLAIGARRTDDAIKQWRRAMSVKSGGVRRVIVAPSLVPADWTGPAGCDGDLVEPDGDGPQLVLASWAVEDDEQLRSLVKHLHARLKAEAPVLRARIRGLLERPIATDAIYGPPEPSLTDALRRWEKHVSRLEGVLRDGDDLTLDELARIECLLQEMATHQAKFELRGGRRAAERVGLVSRLQRLLDVQASRDAQGSLTRVLSTLTALVLVPSLVAAVYGANVAVPFRDTLEGWKTMLAFMASSAVLSYSATRGLRPSATTRRLRFVPPGHIGRQPDDPSWREAVAIAVMAGAAGAALWRALDGLDPPGPVSSTEAALWFCAAGVALVLLALFGRDVRHRSNVHAGLIAIAAFGGWSTGLAVLLTRPLDAVAATVALLIAGAFALVGDLSRWLAEDRRQRHRR